MNSSKENKSDGNKSNGNKTSDKKPSNSYSMLQMKMKEVVKSKKPVNPPPKSSSSTSSKKTNDKSSKQDKDKSVPAKQDNKNSTKVPKPEPQDTDPDLPDRSFGDYFCKICDSHMNSDAMWEAHVTGKRHIKNVKKGDTDSKYDDLNVESDIKYELRNVKDPVIGLSYIHEIRRREPGVPAMYNCFLCHASIATIPLVIEHVIGMKHRLNFLRENNPEEHQLIESTNLKKGHMEPLIHEAAAKLESKFGRGTVKVKQEKPKPAVSTYKRGRDDSDDEKSGYRKPSKNKFNEDKFPAVWKSVDVSGRSRGESSRRDRDRDDFESRRDRETRSQYPASYSPIDEFSVDRSYRDRITPERDNFPRGYSRSPERDNYPRRSEYYGPALPEDYPRVSDDIRRPLDPYSSSLYSDSRSYQPVDNMLNSPTYNRSAPEARTIQPGRAPKDMFKDFVTQIAALPTELFLKIVLMKLDTIELKGLDELNMLSKVIGKAYNVMTSKLPADLQAMIKERIAQSENGPKMASAMSNLSGIGPTNVQSGMNTDMRFNAPNPQVAQKFDINAINDLIFGARKEVEQASMTQQSQSSNFNNANIPPPVSHPYQMPTNAVSHRPNFTPTNNGPPPPRLPNYPPPVNASPISNPPNFPPPNATPQSHPNYQNYYNSPPKAQSIPGLTLTENESPQSQQWLGPSARGNNFSFRRF